MKKAKQQQEAGQSHATPSSTAKPSKGCNAGKGRKGKGKDKEEDANSEGKIPEEKGEKGEDQEGEIEEIQKKGKGKGKDKVPTCFARRRCPENGLPKARWLSLRYAFEKYVKFALKTYSSHEAFQLKLKKSG